MPTRRRSRRLLPPVLVCAVLVALMTSACTAPGREPDRASQQTADGKVRTPVPAPTPTAELAVLDDLPVASELPLAAEPPAPPSAMAGTDATGAAAAAEHFLALMDHAFSTLDAGPMMAMCDPGSRWCASVADQTAQARAARGEGAVHMSADTALPSQLKVDPRDDGTFVVHLTGQHTTTTTWTDPATGITQVHISDPEAMPFAIHLEPRPSGWVVLGVN